MNYRDQMMEMEQVLVQEEKKTPKKKSVIAHRWTPAELKQMAIQVEILMAKGETRLNHLAKHLKVSTWTAKKVLRMVEGRQKRETLNIQKLLINPKTAIRRLVPLLDNPNPVVIKQAKGWLLKIAEWMED